MRLDQYFDKLSNAIMQFQYLELTLKFYIRDCDRIIQNSVKEVFHYSVREKEIDKMPLGRLIDEFSRRSNRKDIVKVLKKLNKLRNEIVHSAYVLSIEEQSDSDKLKDYSKKLTSIMNTVKACLKQLVQENARISNQPIPKGLLEQL